MVEKSMCYFVMGALLYSVYECTQYARLVVMVVAVEWKKWLPNVGSGRYSDKHGVIFYLRVECSKSRGGTESPDVNSHMALTSHKSNRAG